MTGISVQKMVVEKAWRGEWAVHWIVDYLHLLTSLCPYLWPFLTCVKLGYDKVGNEISLLESTFQMIHQRRNKASSAPEKHAFSPAQHCCLASLEHWWAKHTPPLLMSPWHTAFYLHSGVDKDGNDSGVHRLYALIYCHQKEQQSFCFLGVQQKLMWLEKVDLELGKTTSSSLKQSQNRASYANHATNTKYVFMSIPVSCNYYSCLLTLLLAFS